MINHLRPIPGALPTVILVSLASLCSSLLGAEEARAAAVYANRSELSLAEFMQRVVEYNETVQARLLAFHAARSQRRAEDGAFEPSLVVSGEHVDRKTPNTIEIERSLRSGGIFTERNDNYTSGIEVLTPVGTHFRFGSSVSTNKLEIGHRNASGWVVDASKNMQLKPDQDYNMLLALNGVTVVLVVDNSSSNVLTFSFAPRVVAGYSFNLNNGMVGIGGHNARATIDNVKVQVLPPTITFQNTETFADNVADLLIGAQVGQWVISGNRDAAAPDATAGFAVSNSSLALSASSILLFDTTVKAGANGTSAGIVFDYYDANNFKFAAIVAGTNQVVIGHHTKSGWAIDATVAATITAGTDYTLALTLKGTTVSVLLNPSTNAAGQAVAAAALGYVFNAVIVDGQAGLFTRGGASSFAGYTYKTDDPKYAAGAGLT